MTSTRLQFADFLHSDSHPMRLLHNGHKAVAPQLNILNGSVKQLEIEARKYRGDCEVQFRVGKTALWSMH